MDLIVARISLYGDETPPCEEAKKKKFPVFHIRTVSEVEYNMRFSKQEGLWRSKGFNHTTTEEGYVKRQEEDKERWYVEINSMEELFKFYEKYGKLVIVSDYLSLTPSLEIYDDYRE